MFAGSSDVGRRPLSCGDQVASKSKGEASNPGSSACGLLPLGQAPQSVWSTISFQYNGRSATRRCGWCLSSRFLKPFSVPTCPLY